jgi:hypothetical protein
MTLECPVKEEKENAVSTVSKPMGRYGSVHSRRRFRFNVRLKIRKKDLTLLAQNM